MPRFLVPHLPADSQVELPPAEARHAVRSLRLGPGARIVLFDGTGTSCEAEILSVGEGRVIARTGAARPAEKGMTIEIASALPKGKRLAWMIQKLTELGVAQFTPVVFKRSVVRWSASRSSKAEKIVAEAAKQSGRSSLMALEAEVTVEELASRGGTSYVAAPGAAKTLVQAGPSEKVARIVIGPEGGMLPSELEALGGTRVSLGPTILRIETAAVAAASVMAQL